MNELECLKHFVDIVEQQGLSRASQVSGVATSILSNQLSWLEKTYQTRLIERSTRRFQVTEAGVLCFERAKQLLHFLNNTEKSLHSMENELVGEVKISYPKLLLEQLCQQAFFKLNQRFTKLNLLLYSDRLPYEVLDGRLDIVISDIYVEDENLMRYKLADLTRHVYGSPTYFRRHGKPKTVADLTKHNCLVNLHDSFKYQWPFEDSKSAYFTGNFSSEDFHMLYKAVEQGVGLYWFPDLMINTIKSKHNLLPLRLDKDLAKSHVYFYCRRSHREAQIKISMNFLFDYLNEMINE